MPKTKITGKDYQDSIWEENKSEYGSTAILQSNLVPTITLAKQK